MPEPELQTILDDVRTIKSILTTTDAPLPAVWKPLYFVVVPTLLVIATLKFLVPGLASASFLETSLWLWAPAVAVAAVLVAVMVRRDLKTTGTRFLVQSRVRIFFFTRLVLAPAILILAFLLSLNPAYSMEGAMMLLVAVGMTQGIMVLPGEFKSVPLLLLGVGAAELALNLRGPGWTLVNTIGVAFCFGWAGYLLRRETTKWEGPNRG